MKITFKAIARAAGYRVKTSYSKYPNMGLDWNDYSWWYDLDEDEVCKGRFLTEQEAYEDCCQVCGLVEFEEE